MDTSSTTAARGPARGLRLPFAALVVALASCAVTGCGGPTAGSSASSAAGSDVAGSGGASADLAQGPGTAARPAVQQRAVVSTGSVSLSSRDVADVRDRVDRLLTAYDGFVADERTGTDPRGRPDRSTLVLRVPSRDFDALMRRLAGLGTLHSSSRQAQDVTTRVIDVGQRITAEQVGLRRLEQLTRTAGSLSALLAVEKQVTERRASLDSLVQQRAYLSDQTSLATITLRIDRAQATSPPASDGRGGFLGGLGDGWSALVAVVGGLLRGTGAALPFALVALVLWLPVRAVVRRVRRAPRDEDRSAGRLVGVHEVGQPGQGVRGRWPAAPRGRG